MSRLHLACVLSVLTCGCSYLPAEEFAIDPSFPPEEQELIVEALEDWFEADPELRVPYYIGHGKNGSIENRKPRVGCTGQGAATELDYTRRPRITVCRSDIFGAEQFRQAIRHEVGHALSGREDHLPPDHVMSLDLDFVSDQVTDADVAYVNQ